MNILLKVGARTCQITRKPVHGEFNFHFDQTRWYKRNARHIICLVKSDGIFKMARMDVSFHMLLLCPEGCFEMLYSLSCYLLSRETDLVHTYMFVCWFKR